jgi:hypothetical protein
MPHRQLSIVSRSNRMNFKHEPALPRASRRTGGHAAILIYAASLIAATATPVRAEDTGITADFRRAGAAVGHAAREVGREAKNVGVEMGHDAKKAGVAIADGAVSAGTGIAHGAKKVGKEIGTGARTAGRVVGNAARQSMDAVRDAPNNVKTSMTGERTTE